MPCLFGVVTAQRYPWGNALSERPGSPHAELPALRRFLLIDGLASLKAASREHYESFRRQALWRSHVGVKPLARTLLPPARVRLAPLPPSAVKGMRPHSHRHAVARVPKLSVYFLAQLAKAA